MIVQRDRTDPVEEWLEVLEEEEVEPLEERGLVRDGGSSRLEEEEDTVEERGETVEEAELSSGEDSSLRTVEVEELTEEEDTDRDRWASRLGEEETLGLGSSSSQLEEHGEDRLEEVREDGDRLEVMEELLEEDTVGDTEKRDNVHTSHTRYCTNPRTLFC